MDVVKQVEHWWHSAEEEMEFVEFARHWRHTRQVLFHTHLAVELALKAAVCKATEDVPPKTQDLINLVDLSKIPISNEQRRFLGRLNKFNISGRYTDAKPIEPDQIDAEDITSKSIEFIKWLKTQLFKA